MALNYEKSSASESIKNSQMELKTANAIYCVCRSSNIDTFMICCDFCEEWFHGDCIGVSEISANDIEMYYCKRCISLNPKLRITYKRKMAAKRKNTAKKRMKSKTGVRYTPNRIDIQDVFGGYVFPSSVVNDPSNPDVLDVNPSMATETSSTDPRTMNDEALAQILEIDTSTRKAKTIANKIITDQNETFKMAKPKEKNPPVLKQCDGPSCVKVARPNSKYCSDACGIKLGTNRILEILPQRLQQRKTPCAADEVSKMKLAAIRRKQKQIQSSIEQINIKIMQLLQLVQKSKNSREDSVVEEDFEEENSTLDCKLCGAEVQMKMLVKHMEHCYKKQERRLLLTGGDATTKPDDLEWNVFCNHKMGRQGYCKQFKVMCPLHHKDPSRGDDEVCGYPLAMNLAECSGRFCGRPRKNCLRHPKNWEENFRADLDMEKLQFLLKLCELEKQELALRRNMAARGNLISLLMHETIVH